MEPQMMFSTAGPLLRDIPHAPLTILLTFLLFKKLSAVDNGQLVYYGGKKTHQEQDYSVVKNF